MEAKMLPPMYDDPDINHYGMLRTNESTIHYCSGAMLTDQFFSTTATCFFFLRERVRERLWELYLFGKLRFNMYLSEALYKVERVYYPKDYKTSGGNIALCEMNVDEDKKLRPLTPLKVMSEGPIPNDITFTMIVWDVENEIDKLCVTTTSIEKCFDHEEGTNEEVIKARKRHNICLILPMTYYNVLKRNSGVGKISSGGQGTSSPGIINPERGEGNPVFANKLLVGFISGHRTYENDTDVYLKCTLATPYKPFLMLPEAIRTPSNKDKWSLIW